MVYNHIVYMLSLRFNDSYQTKNNNYKKKHTAETSTNLPLTGAPNEDWDQPAHSQFQNLHRAKTAKDTKPPNAAIEDSDQTSQMDRPIRVLVGLTLRRYIYVLLYDNICQQSDRILI